MMKLSCTTFTDFHQNTLKEKFKVRNTERCSIISLRAFNCNCICLRVLSRPLHIKTSSWDVLLGQSHKLSWCCVHTNRSTQRDEAEMSTAPVSFTGNGFFLCWPYLSLPAVLIEECLYPPLPLSVTANTSGQVLALVCHSNKHRQHCRSCNPDSMSSLLSAFLGASFFSSSLSCDL